MPRRIKISGACQSAGIAEVLKLVFEKDSISVIQRPDVRDPTPFIEEIKTADVWLTTDETSSSLLEIKSHNPNLEMVAWPQLTFPAFHPDITVPYGPTPVSPIGCSYNSAICLWAWKSNVPRDRVARLFCAEVFEGLGYLDAWTPSVSSMRKDFETCRLDFDAFFQPVKRQGVFMHSNLHAKLGPIVQLGKQLGVALGAPSSVLDEPLESFLGDPLIFDSVWPVYPEIGDVLGVPSCYRWKYRHSYCNSLQDYIGASYDAYDAPGVERSLVNSTRFNDGIFDRVLNEYL